MAQEQKGVVDPATIWVMQQGQQAGRLGLTLSTEERLLSLGTF